MKARKEEFKYPKCPICGEKVNPAECVVSGFVFDKDGSEQKRMVMLHEECEDKFSKALEDGKSVSYDLFSHRIEIE